jgi:hypothetical protein
MAKGLPLLFRRVVLVWWAQQNAEKRDVHSAAGLWISTPLIQFRLISNNKRACIDWSGHLAQRAV